MAEKIAARTDGKELRSRLENVNGELQRIGATVRRDAESLDRLRKMLDVNYVGDLIHLIEDMERQVASASESAAQSAEETEEYRRRLAEEEERLEKLWDAYKIQERDVKQASEKGERLERELADRHTSFMESESLVAEKERDLRRSEDDNESLRETIRVLESRQSELADVDDLKSRVDDLEQKYSAEKERLAKLYTVYEELEGERDNLRSKVEEWERWFQQAAPHFEQGYRAVKRRSGSAPPSSKE